MRLPRLSHAGETQFRSCHGLGSSSSLSGAGGGGFDDADPPVCTSTPRSVRDRPLPFSVSLFDAVPFGGKRKPCSHVDSTRRVPVTQSAPLDVGKPREPAPMGAVPGVGSVHVAR
eukprot:5735580-Pyramimonas_sp.AAC.1